MQHEFIVRTGADFGQAASQLRRTRGLTQNQAAEEVGLNRSYVSEIELGRTTRLIDHILRMLRRLGATVTITWDSGTLDKISLSDRDDSPTASTSE